MGSLAETLQGSMYRMGRALKGRNYRLFFTGQAISLTGVWMQHIAVSWLVYKLSGSPFMLGFVAFTGQMPIFFLSSVGGVVADRWEKRKILLTIQTISMAHALVLAFLTMTGLIKIWHLVALGIVPGVLQAIDIPTRQAFVIEIVEKKEDLVNAIALNSFMFNSARLIGPSLGGVLIERAGEGICFLINGLGFFAAMFSLLKMRLMHSRREKGHIPFFQSISEGVKYAFQSVPIRYLILFMAFIHVTAGPFLVLMPAFVKDVLHGGPRTLGLIMGSSALGATISALYLAMRRSVVGLGKVIIFSTSLFGVALLFLSFSHILPLALFFVFFAGLGMMLHLTSTNTLLQTIVEEDKRGRIMSLFAMCSLGVLPFGSLLVGSLGSILGIRGAILVEGMLCLIGSGVFLSKHKNIKRAIRPVYERLGII